MNRRILILGTVPPPIGGVTIHIKRLLNYLNTNNYNFKFLDFKRSKFMELTWSFLCYKYIHFHTSNSYFRFLLILLGNAFNKKMIFTYHGNFGQYNKVKNFIDRLSVRISFIPIMLNKRSLEKAIKVNKSAILIPAFIPPVEGELLDKAIFDKIQRICESYKYIFATNAHNVSFDKDGNEIYQISTLVNLFSKINDKALIISDPSGNYKCFLQRGRFSLTDNILIIDEPHSFFEVLKLSDALLRITTTDGDSLSIKEALYLGKTVITTNVVDRPHGVILLENKEQNIKHAIEEFNGDSMNIYSGIENGAECLLNFYKSINGK